MFQRRLFTIQSLWRKYNATGNVRDLRRNPRGRVTTPGQDWYIINQHVRRRQTTATSTARATIGTHQRPIGRQTVVNRLRDAGLQSRRPLKGLVLTLRHRQERLRWARRHIRMTRADWGRVLFTDESKFNRFKPDGNFLFYVFPTFN